MAPLAHVDAVRCIGKSGLSLPLVRVYRDAAGPPLLVRAQVSHHLAPQDDSARVGVALTRVLKAHADEVEADGGDEDWSPAAGGGEAVSAVRTSSRQPASARRRSANARRAAPARRSAWRPFKRPRRRWRS
jgi:hypothetical protein